MKVWSKLRKNFQQSTGTPGCDKYLLFKMKIKSTKLIIAVFENAINSNFTKNIKNLM